MSVAINKSDLIKHRKVNRHFQKDVSIDMIEKELGLNNVKPIHLPSSESDENFERDNEYFKGMYEDELRKLYEKI